jgi:hypothetical protein
MHVGVEKNRRSYEGGRCRMVSAERRGQSPSKDHPTLSGQSTKGRTLKEGSDVGKFPERTYSVCAAKLTWKERPQPKY